MEIPFSHLDLSGIRCGAKSKQNKNRAQNRSLEGDHSTGTDFAYYLAQLDAGLATGTNSHVYCVENVVGYGEASAEADDNQQDQEDEQTAHNTLRSFWTEHHESFSFRSFTGSFRVLSGLHYGSAQRRSRFFGLEVQKCDKSGLHLNCCGRRSFNVGIMFLHQTVKPVKPVTYVESDHLTLY